MTDATRPGTWPSFPTDDQPSPWIAPTVEPSTPRGNSPVVLVMARLSARVGNPAIQDQQTRSNAVVTEGFTDLGKSDYVGLEQSTAKLNRLTDRYTALSPRFDAQKAACLG